MMAAQTVEMGSEIRARPAIKGRAGAAAKVPACGYPGLALSFGEAALLD